MLLSQRHSEKTWRIVEEYSPQWVVPAVAIFSLKIGGYFVGIVLRSSPPVCQCLLRFRPQPSIIFMNSRPAGCLIAVVCRVLGASLPANAICHEWPPSSNGSPRLRFSNGSRGLGPPGLHHVRRTYRTYGAFGVGQAISNRSRYTRFLAVHDDSKWLSCHSNRGVNLVREVVLLELCSGLIHEEKDMFQERNVEQNSLSKVRTLHRLDYPRHRWHRVPNAPTSCELSG